MSSWDIKQGDLVQNKRSHYDAINKRVSTHVFEVVRGPYTARFMDAQDYEMEAHGMGEYAGSYGTAIDVIALTGPDQGLTFIKRKRSMYTKVESGETAEN